MKKNTTFEQEMLKTGTIPNIAAGIITIVYVIFFAGLTFEQLVRPAILAFFLLLFIQFFVAPLTNKILTKKISADLESWKEGELDKTERTKLVQDLMSCPKKIALQVLVVFGIGIGLWTATFHSVFQITILRAWLSFGSAFLGAYIAAILALNYSERLCSKYSKRIINDGIQEKSIYRYRFFGTSETSLLALSSIVPIILTNTITILIFYRIISEKTLIKTELIPVFLITMCNTSLIIILTAFVFLQLRTSLSTISNALTNIKTEQLEITKPMETDLSNEISYIIYLINKVFHLLLSIIKNTQQMGFEVQTASRDLSISTNQTSETALVQSTAIKEIVASMEDSDALSKNIINRVIEVTLISAKTNSDVDDGFYILEQTLLKMQEIQNSNNIIITGITRLKNSLKNIQEIADLISNIADLTKIIAFNAELEAASLNDSNSNFNYVADEIRRLAENTVESTRSIRANITNINKTANNLVEKSHDGTQKINEGVIITRELHNYFIKLQEAAETTRLSSTKIQNVVKEQKNSQQQILATLKQLSIGLEDITTSTQNINTQAETLETLSQSLDTINLKDN